MKNGCLNPVVSMRILSFITFIFSLVIIAGCSTQNDKVKAISLNLFDSNRSRSVPVSLYFETDLNNSYKQCVIISNGYGVKNTEYTFIAKKLAKLGYFVVSIQHDLPTDEPLARTGNIFTLRKPVWERGMENILFVISELKTKYTHLDFNKLIIIGHSNGGDISMLFCTKYPDLVTAAITLDNLRMPIPKLKHPRILSLRATDTKPDNRVIPSDEEQKEYEIKVVKLKSGEHNDLCDFGNFELKQSILDELEKFIQ